MDESVLDSIRKSGWNIGTDDVTRILEEPSAALTLALSAAAASSNRLNSGMPDSSLVAVHQNQVSLWLAIHDRLLDMEDRAEAARSAEVIAKQYEERVQFPKPTYGSRIPDVFARQGFAKTPPFAQPDSSGSAGGPVT
jgi:hypothetical protein